MIRVTCVVFMCIFACTLACYSPSVSAVSSGPLPIKFNTTKYNVTMRDGVKLSTWVDFPFDRKCGGGAGLCPTVIDRYV
jgi:hypothetical protein